MGCNSKSKSNKTNFFWKTEWYRCYNLWTRRQVHGY